MHSDFFVMIFALTRNPQPVVAIADFSIIGFFIAANHSLHSTVQLLIHT
jgi:hypothetical protein